MKNEAFRKAHFDGWKKNETEPSERSILCQDLECWDIVPSGFQALGFWTDPFILDS
ncbi:hypothetical protein GLOIN_2v1764636 [Rhizophagus irregularis DAOM 181602=DAOM 197198]|uniref:Uncharacterized protein n=1 Tax=Rhizophagus irregularis (strain DAOM 181602 / DAOM 197198 / MUCL 43194) TaxID=747089 RepID=A0A2P4QRB1_RHIID|nr:hypothetical protein GLOIN_2v1764636 [Rhizophagus irregularis DAOM 181602=DAOM 197198]POG80183.1 hypothetical protein GLOIN_2v1764636 [Rhizophagus irregularis DAOM 181602=DAOM 197198]GBC25963.2 hypothetical protein GLOIN_2v1764636 [Rhizophagus irregularis DAOM 181602=DAOM 197198]|eukprot:XP_025187049.1 hypothetical protein GLOIN_2v1764636 [Rhizophagus irregularis DAOM 181602=DAOM 197198]